jgi:hypothetical protein
MSTTDPRNISAKFGAYVTKTAIAAGYNLGDDTDRLALATAACITRVELAHVLDGRRIPDPSRFEYLASALGVTGWALITESGLVPDRAPETPSAPDPAAVVVARVQAEINRIAGLPTVTRDDGRADTFAVGARWAIRLIGAVLDGEDPDAVFEPVSRVPDRPTLRVVTTERDTTP